MKSIREQYRRDIYRPFTAAVRDYALVKEGDRIAVCISGGKDSMLLAKCMQEYRAHSPLHFENVFLMMDPGYSAENRERIFENARLLEIPLTVFETDVFAAVDAMGGQPCHMCAKMRRGYLFRKAKELGCNKIALGHHCDDVIETTLMSMFYEGRVQTMPPKKRSDNVEGMELIRPLYRVRESAVKRWRDENELTFLACACRFTKDSATDVHLSKRAETKQLIARLEASNPDIARNIFRSVHNVSLNTMLGWKINGQYHTFTELYEKESNEL